MTDLGIAHNLIRYISKRSYPNYDKKEAIKCAIKDLAECRKKYGFRIMKRAYNHADCTGVEKFYYLCKAMHKETLKKTK